MLSNYSRVRLLTDKYKSLGASSFDIGYIIEVYPDENYEVEFSGVDGVTYAQFAAHADDVQLAESTYDAPVRKHPAKTI